MNITGCMIVDGTRTTLLLSLVSELFEISLTGRKIRSCMERDVWKSAFYSIFIFCYLLENRLRDKREIISHSSRNSSVVLFSMAVSILYVLTIICPTYAQTDALSTGKAKYFVALMRADFHSQNDLVEIYSSYLNNDDIALSHPNEENLGNTMQLPGKHGVQYFSLSEIMRNVDSLKARGVDIVSYDLEKENASSQELKDPVASVKTASEAVHKDNMKFMVSHSMMLTADFGTQFAPFVDIYNIQAQSLQSRPNEYNDFVEQTVRELRSVNPEISITVQVSTARGSLEGMKESIALVIDIVDGTSSWYTDDREGLNRLSNFVKWFDNNYRKE